MNFAWTWCRCRRSLRRQPWPVAALAAAFTLLMLLAGSARLAAFVADAVLPRLADNVHVIAYLREDMTADKASALAEIVAHVPGVERVRHVDSREALQRLRDEAAELGGVAELLDGVEEGFLPASLEIALRSTEALGDRGRALAERLRRIPGVAEVDAMEAGLARLHSLLALLRGLAWGLLALAVIVGIAGLGFPLLLGRQSRYEDVAVLTLLGETPAAIGRPWALMGALAAVVGSGLAWLMLWMAHRQTSSLLAQLFGAWVPNQIPFVPWHEILGSISAAVVVGAWIGRRAMPTIRGRRYV